MKLCHCLAIGIVLFQLQLPCKGQSRIHFTKDEVPQYDTGERNWNINRGLSNRRNSTVATSSVQGKCNSIDWPQDNFLSGPFPVNGPYTRLCPRIRGIFGISTTCNLYSNCEDGCFTVNRCPPFQNFNPERKSCIAAEKYQCSKPETTEDWWSVITKYGSEIKNEDSDKINFPTNTPVRRGSVETIVNANRFSQENGRGNNRKIILLEAPIRKGTTDGFGGDVNPRSKSSQRENIVSSAKYVNSAPFTSASQINCQEEQVGNFAHPESCHLYIECANGNQLTKRCPPGTVFNPDLTVCDWARNVPECTAESESFKLKPSISNNNRGEGGESAGLNGNPGNHRSLKRSAPTQKSSRLCIASENYVEPHAEYCNKYQVCSNGRIFTETCGPGTLFDPLNSVCNFPDRVDCESRKADLGTYGCQKQHTYRTSHWEFCNKFVECDKGVLAIKTCPSGLVFDVETGNCDYAHRIECRKPISLEHDTDINSGLPVAIRSVRSISDYICEEQNYIAPHPRCNKFVECEEKRLFVKSCGPGTVYNKYIGVCDWAYNTREPDETECTAYKECKGGEWIGRSCQGGFQFDSVRRKCERAENVECRQNKEPPPAVSK